MNIDTLSSFLTPEAIAILEKKHNAKYVFESCIKFGNGSWANFPAAIFYTEQAHPKGSNYFAIFQEYDLDGILSVPMITNGISATEPVYTGIVSKDKIIYSRYRYDYRKGEYGAIDGGRDYIKISGYPKIVKFKVVKDHLEIFE